MDDQLGKRYAPFGERIYSCLKGDNMNTIKLKNKNGGFIEVSQEHAAILLGNGQEWAKYNADVEIPSEPEIKEEIQEEVKEAPIKKQTKKKAKKKTSKK